MRTEYPIPRKKEMPLAETQTLTMTQEAAEDRDEDPYQDQELSQEDHIKNFEENWENMYFTATSDLKEDDKQF